jgi:hypothetical protein
LAARSRSASDAEARQKAVEELRPRVDLREELALVGEDIKVASTTERLPSGARMNR